MAMVLQQMLNAKQKIVEPPREFKQLPMQTAALGPRRMASSDTTENKVDGQWDWVFLCEVLASTPRLGSTAQLGFSVGFGW